MILAELCMNCSIKSSIHYIFLVSQQSLQLKSMIYKTTAQRRLYSYYGLTLDILIEYSGNDNLEMQSCTEIKPAASRFILKTRWVTWVHPAAGTFSFHRNQSRPAPCRHMRHQTISSPLNLSRSVGQRAVQHANKWTLKCIRYLVENKVVFETCAPRILLITGTSQNNKKKETKYRNFTHSSRPIHNMISRRYRRWTHSGRLWPTVGPWTQPFLRSVDFPNKSRLTAGLRGNSAGTLCCRCPGKSVFAETPAALLLWRRNRVSSRAVPLPPSAWTASAPEPGTVSGKRSATDSLSAERSSAAANCDATYLRLLVLLLQLLSVAELLDGLAEAAVLQALYSGLHRGQEDLQLCGPLGVLSSSTHVLMDLLSAGRGREKGGRNIYWCTEMAAEFQTQSLQFNTLNKTPPWNNSLPPDSLG